MRSHPLRSVQRGSTLLVGMIFLTLITLMVLTAFQLSMGNTQAVGNMQFREQALAAANFAMEEKTAGNFSTDAARDSTKTFVDLNQDGTTDLIATVAAPVCVTYTNEVSVPPSSLSLGAGFSEVGDQWNVLLELDIEVNDPVTNANIRTVAGVRAIMKTPWRNTWCP